MSDASLPDFDALALAAYPRDSERGPRGALETLWRAVLGLPEWAFAIDPARVVDPHAFVASHEDKDCVFAFTDGDRVAGFARMNGLIDLSGASFNLSLPLPGVFDWLESAAARGDFSTVQFNFGGIAWFAPVSQLAIIRAHLGDLTA